MMNADSGWHDGITWGGIVVLSHE